MFAFKACPWHKREACYYDGDYMSTMAAKNKSPVQAGPVNSHLNRAANPLNIICVYAYFQHLFP